MSDVSRETSKPESATPPGKNKRSSVYIYLLILFGAAFLMLLLAYFVQQRNSESAISDLRDSMNLSRTELLAEVETLKEDNESLQQDIEQLSTQLDSLQEENATLNRQLEAERSSAEELNDRTGVLTSMAILEQAIRDGNYEVAAQKARNLCQGDWELDLGIANLDGSEHFSPRERLAELIPLLEEEGALEPGELNIP